jgi:integrase/recombinase XerC
MEAPDIQAYCVYLQDKGHAPATVNRRLQALRKFFTFTTSQGWTRANPADDVSLLGETVSDRSRFLTSEDVTRLLAAVRQGRARWVDRDWTLFQLFLGVGLKLSELIKVQLADIHLEADEPYMEVRGASGKPERTVPLESDVSAALHSYLPVRRASPGVQHLMVNRDGNPLSTRSVQRLLHHYAAAAGLDGLTSQALRFQYAKRLYESSKDIATVARLLGHRHLATTIRYLRPSAPPRVQHQAQPPEPASAGGDSEGHPTEV